MNQKFSRRGRLALTLAFTLLLLSGCAGELTERESVDLSEYAIESNAPAPQEDCFETQEESVLLSVLKPDSLEIVPTATVIEMSGGISRAEAVLNALMHEAMGSDRFWPNLTETQLELSGNIATVNLPARARALTTEELYAVRAAIADTLCGLPEISYVNVLVGGREEGLDLGATFPVGTLTRAESMNLQMAYDREDDLRTSGEGFSRLTTLYFPTENGAMLLPEVRNISYSAVKPIEYLYSILDELGKGGANSLVCAELPAPMEYIEEMPEIVRAQDGASRVIDIRFSEELDEALLQAGLTRGIYYAMLTDTLMGFVPGIEGVQMTIGDTTIEELDGTQTPDGRTLQFTDGLATKTDFQGLIGAQMTICAKAGNRLTRAQSVTAQPEGDSPRAQLRVMMEMEDGALPDGLTEQDILAVDVRAEVIVLNLSQRFADALAELSQEEERLAIYAMVNTLTEGRRAQRVDFFFAGKQVSRLAGGVELRGSFIRNPGLVVEK